MSAALRQEQQRSALLQRKFHPVSTVGYGHLPAAVRFVPDSLHTLPRQLRLTIGRRPPVYFNRYISPPRLVTSLVLTYMDMKYLAFQ